MPYSKIATELGCSKATISYHTKRQNIASTPRPSYDWVAIQTFYDEGNSATKCREHFGCCKETCASSVRKGNLKIKDHRIPLDDLLTENSPHSRGHVKKRIIKAGLLKNECAECGQGPEWRGKKLVMVLDHINGVNNDNRLNNLRLLCPNCNSQTDTFSGKNVKRK